MSIEKKWYVYLLCDPDTEEPFYVGKGTGDRMNQHELLKPYDCNEIKKQVIRTIHDSGKEVLKKKIAEFDSEMDAYIYEWGTINMYGDRITNVGWGDRRKTSSPRVKKEKPVSPALLWTTKEVADYLQIPASEVPQIKDLPFVDLCGVLGKKGIRFIPAQVKSWKHAKVSNCNAVS